ncbi:MAG: hypothetical protein C4523_05930 [Myxococcales bacterium]|nr:MAG: hypothetical protein C4523_05930 [Myxococcales bacterium]
MAMLKRVIGAIFLAMLLLPLGACAMNLHPYEINQKIVKGEIYIGMTTDELKRAVGDEKMCATKSTEYTKEGEVIICEYGTGLGRPTEGDPVKPWIMLTIQNGKVTAIKKWVYQ